MRKALALAVMLLAVSAACGGGGGETEQTRESPEARTDAAPVTLAGTTNEHGSEDATGETELEVELDDFYFEPTFIKTAAGAKLTLELHNEGKAQHTFTIDGAGVDEAVDPGSEKTISVTVPSAATAFYCRFHRASGMQGAFFFKEGESVGTGSAPAGTAAPRSTSGY